MTNWLGKFHEESPELGTDTTDRVPKTGSVSVMSVPESGLLPEKLPGQVVATPVRSDDVACHPPLSPGWIVVYRDRTGKLRGGFDERDQGTVQACRWDRKGWVVELTNGETLPASIIRAVGRVNPQGKIIEAWTVASHGLNGRLNAEQALQASVSGGWHQRPGGTA